MTDAALKLLAFDEEDLAILSCHLQDAELTVGDLIYLPREHRFALAVDRFDWETAATAKANRRRRTAVHFDGVKSVRSRDIPLEAKDTHMTLLAISFEPTDSPAGSVHLHFAGGACIKLEVEMLEAALADLGPTWACSCCPTHPEVKDA
jgi:hypothetical protein